jgi:hypothetical protein
MSSDDDIVKRLRLTPVLMKYDEMGYPRTDYEACKKFVNDEGVKLMRDAADEIERLRKERDEAEQMRSDIQRLCAEIRIIRIDNLRTNEESEKFRNERDEARREVCLLRASTTSAVSLHGYAAERGWEEIFADDPEHERDA